MKPLDRALECFAPSTEAQRERAAEVIARLVTAYQNDLKGIEAFPGVKKVLARLQTGIGKIQGALDDLGKGFPGALGTMRDAATMDELGRILNHLKRDIERRMEPLKPAQREATERPELIWNCMKALEGFHKSNRVTNAIVAELGRAVHELATGQPVSGPSTWDLEAKNVAAMRRRHQRELPTVLAALAQAAKEANERYGNATWGEIKKREAICEK